MSRLLDRLSKVKKLPNSQYDSNEYPSNYDLNAQAQNPEYQEQYQEQPPQQYQQEYQQPQQPMQPLAQEYDRIQAKALEYDKEISAIEKTNPHTLFREVVTNPMPKGVYPMTIMGRPVDFRMLESYLVYKISPKSITTLMRFNHAKTLEEVKGYSKRPPMRAGKGFTIILLLVGAVIMLLLGFFILTNQEAIGGFLKGMFGGLM